MSAGWTSGKDLLNVAESVLATFGDVVPAETLSALQDGAGRFAFLVNQREQQQIYDLIDNAIATGQTVSALADSISTSFQDGYHVTDDDGNLVRTIPSDSWSNMVARTELSRAQTAGQVAIYNTAGVQTVIWQSNHGQTVCDECSDADGAVVPLGEIFEMVGVDAPPAHPCCCCNVLPYDEDVRSPYVQEKEAA